MQYTCYGLLCHPILAVDDSDHTGQPRGDSNWTIIDGPLEPTVCYGGDVLLVTSFLFRARGVSDGLRTAQLKRGKVQPPENRW